MEYIVCDIKQNLWSCILFNKLIRYLTSKPHLFVEVFTVKGKISKYLSFRGYGFISVKEHEKDIFFHMSNYPPRQLPNQDQIVEFDVIETSKGLEAVNIQILEELSSETIVQESKDTEKEIAASKDNDLHQLKGVGPIYKALLEKAQVKTCQEVADYNPEVLLANILSINAKEQITKRPPTLTQVKDWIEFAAQVVE
jgi:cold shock CspA family protein